MNMFLADGRRERHLLSEMQDSLSSVTMDGGPPLEQVLQPLAALTRSVDAATYSIVETAEGRDWRWFACAGLRKAKGDPAQITRDFFLSCRQDWPGYSLSRPEASARNQVVICSEEENPAAPRRFAAMPDLYARLGTKGFDTMRAVVCDGARLLGWVGVFRDEPFVRAEAAAFQSIVPAIQRHLLNREQLAAPLLRAAALPAALEAISRPAYVVGRSGDILLCNHHGRLHMEAARAAAQVVIQDAVGAGRNYVSHPAAEVTRLRCSGHPDHYLVVLTAQRGELHHRLAMAAREWHLTGRQLQVLEEVIRGRCNKAIAQNLLCAERTVEVHITALLNRSRSASRTEMTARFWLEL